MTVQDQVGQYFEEIRVESIDFVPINDATHDAAYPGLIITKATQHANITIKNTNDEVEVVIFADNGVLETCEDAQKAMRNIMKDLYTDKQVGMNIDRVLFTSWGYFTVSIGSDDGQRLANAKFPWPEYKEFWAAIQQARPFLDEEGPLSRRTWSDNMGC